MVSRETISNIFFWCLESVFCPAAVINSVMVAKRKKRVSFADCEITPSLPHCVETGQMQWNALSDVYLILDSCLPQLLTPCSYCICLGFVGRHKLLIVIANWPALCKYNVLVFPHVPLEFCC